MIYTVLCDKVALYPIILLGRGGCKELVTGLVKDHDGPSDNPAIIYESSEGLNFRACEPWLNQSVC